MGERLERSCRACRYYVVQEQPVGTGTTEKQGQCRRFPPVGPGYGQFPVVATNCWCGEFARRHER